MAFGWGVPLEPQGSELEIISPKPWHQFLKSVLSFLNYIYGVQQEKIQPWPDGAKFARSFRLLSKSEANFAE